MLTNILYFFAGAGLCTLCVSGKLYAQMKSTSGRIRLSLDKLLQAVNTRRRAEAAAKQI